MARKKMNEKEKQDWEDLYYYVKNIMGYDENQSLSNTMVLRLKGLSTNKFIENKNVKSTANYSYETILNTFKFSSADIKNALRTVTWSNEIHKFNYILKIVEKNLNTVYMRMKNKEKAKEEAKSMVLDMPIHTGAEYKPREKKKDRFSELW